MNRIWSIGLMCLVIATSGGSFARHHIANNVTPIDSQQMLEMKAIDRRVEDVPEPPEVIARIQKIIDSVVGEIDRPMGVWFAAWFR